MNRIEFLKILINSLGNISTEDKLEIQADYDEHFSAGLEEGKTEEEIAQFLGDPKAIAKQFKAECALKNAEINTSAGNIIRAIIAVLSLGFFNLVFVLGPFLAVLGILAGLFSSALAVTISGIVLFFSTIFYPFFSTSINTSQNMDFFPLAPIVSILLSIGLTSAGILFIIGNTYLIKFLYNLTIKYLKLNLKIIKKSEV